MLSIAYSSRAAESFDPAHLVDLLLQSRRNNKRLGLSGMLVYRDGLFLQVIEGPEEVLRNRMAVIASDPRHSDVSVLIEETVDERMFPAWTMGFEEVHIDGDRAPELDAAFADLAAGRDLSDSLPGLRAVIRSFQQGRSGGAA